MPYQVAAQSVSSIATANRRTSSVRFVSDIWRCLTILLSGPPRCPFRTGEHAIHCEHGAAGPCLPLQRLVRQHLIEPCHAKFPEPPMADSIVERLGTRRATAPPRITTSLR